MKIDALGNHVTAKFIISNWFKWKILSVDPIIKKRKLLIYQDEELT